MSQIRATPRQFEFGQKYPHHSQAHMAFLRPYSAITAVERGITEVPSQPGIRVVADAPEDRRLQVQYGAVTLAEDRPPGVTDGHRVVLSFCEALFCIGDLP